MRIAVIGTGHIGGTLGTKWHQAGHDVVYGGRTESASGPGGPTVRSIADALVDADTVLLAVPGKAVAEVLGVYGESLAGMVVIDAANRMGEAEANSRAAVATAAPTAHYARAFNTLGWENFADPPAGAALFFAADAAARPVAEDLIRAVGLEPAFVGDDSAARIVDGVLPLWFSLMQQSGGNRRLAFAIVR